MHKRFIYLFIYGLVFSFPLKSQRPALCTGIPDPGHCLSEELWAEPVRTGEHSSSPGFQMFLALKHLLPSNCRKSGQNAPWRLSRLLWRAAIKLSITWVCKTGACGNWRWDCKETPPCPYSWLPVQTHFQFCLPTLAQCNGAEETH